MIIHGHGVLFDPKKGKSVARFVNGKLDTDDARIIELATMAGFVDPNSSTFSGQVEDSEPTKDELIAIAEERGIEVDKRWGVERLKAAVLGGE